MIVDFEKYTAQDKYRWDLVDDVCMGDTHVKSKGTDYLPSPSGSLDTIDEKKRYDSYKMRANFLGATKQTLQGLIGLAFKQPPTIESNTRLDVVIDDANGDGISIHQHAQKTLAEVLKKGRSGLLVDYPETDSVVSALDEEQNGIQPTIIAYKAQQVKNWRTIKRGAKTLYSLIVLEESYIEYQDFTEEKKKQYRVLELEDDTNYLVSIYRPSDKGYEVYNQYAPLNGQGNRFNYIPFVFVGSENNDHEVDSAPLYDLAVINLAHYRNSADYEEGVFICGQPTPWASGIDDEWHEKNGNIQLGSRSVIPLNVDGKFGIAQAEPNMIAKEAMDQKEKQMIQLGGRLIEQGSAAKTATQARGDYEISHSVLSLSCENVSDAYTQCLEFASEFMSLDTSTVLFALNDDFNTHVADAQMITALVNAWQTGALPKPDLYELMRKFNLVDSNRTNEQLDEDIEIRVV